MAVNLYAGKRAYNLVWNIGKIEPTVSKVFSLENSKWCFVLERVLNVVHNEEDWKMYLRKIHPQQGTHVFLISICLEDRGKKLECVNFMRLIVSKPGTDQIMWRRKSNVSQKYPDLKLDSDVSFVITLLSDHRTIEDIESHTASKHTQTPSYMDLHPCLESLSTDLSKLVAEGSETDMELRCGDHILYAHKAVLIARSQVFAAMLQSEMLEKSKSSIEITDMEFSVLEHFLKYLYAGTLPALDIDTATGLYEAADKYDVQALKSRCARFLREHLTNENACNVLILADAHNDKPLKECVIRYMIQKDILMYMEDDNAFCALYPKLAVDVLYRAYKMMKSPPKT